MKRLDRGTRRAKRFVKKRRVQSRKDKVREALMEHLRDTIRYTLSHDYEVWVRNGKPGGLP